MSAAALRAQILARAALANIFPDGAQADLLVAYYSLLERWNQKINLTALPLAARADSTVDRLLVEPLIASIQIKNAGIDWFDLGTGGGSPALPLKIMRPALRLTMVEAKERKAAFLREAVSNLGLSEASVRTERIEVLARTSDVQAAELITIRAVRLDTEMLDAARKLLKLHGRLFLFRGEPTPPGGSIGFELRDEQNLSPSLGFLSTLERVT